MHIATARSGSWARTASAALAVMTAVGSPSAPTGPHFASAHDGNGASSESPSKARTASVKTRRRSSSAVIRGSVVVSHAAADRCSSSAVSNASTSRTTNSTRT